MKKAIISVMLVGALLLTGCGGQNISRSSAIHGAIVTGTDYVRNEGSYLLYTLEGQNKRILVDTERVSTTEINELISAHKSMGYEGLKMDFITDPTPSFQQKTPMVIAVAIVNQEK